MNKFYIQIVFFLLSIFIYTNNKTLATGLTPKEQNNKTLPTHLLCTNPNEIKNAENFINEAVTQLEHHATNNDSYDVCKWTPLHFATFYRKKHEDTIVQRILFQYFHSNKISEERTIIVMASPNINDHNSKNKDSYKNALIENANSFKTDINSEDDIRSGKLKKTFVNIAGYIIEKKQNSVSIIYLESIDGHTSNYQELPIKKALKNFFNIETVRLINIVET
ncbi:fam-a protein, fragment [Plasmodium vinckei brucechwatti]|uniref:Fam-a protein n=1 Tax=Plasmodium vinckei brucechwatti TaxID=119398 RepID=A0A6V7S9E6_PLAVN|nr:fam-a protein, fragment [Plasmodium vinckei brucechwatti]